MQANPNQNEDPLSRIEHSKALSLIEDELYLARAALRSGQDSSYKSRLQSAFISLQFLLRQEVGE